MIYDKLFYDKTYDKQSAIDEEFDAQIKQKTTQKNH